MCKRNKRAVRFALIAILLFLIVHFSIPMTAHRVRDSVVMVRVCNKEWPPIKHGSGVVVGKGVLLTAGHLIKDANSVNIFLDDKTEIKAFEFYKTDLTDLGLIVFDCNDMPPKSRLSFCESFIGQTVFGISSRYKLQNSFFKGVISAKYRTISLFGKKEILQLDIGTNSGDSGGPIFNRWGLVVGIIVGKQSDNIGYVIPAKIAKLFLAQYRADEAMRKAK